MDGYKLLTNVSHTYPSLAINLEDENYVTTGDDVIAGINEKYGKENVRVEEIAYDVDGKEIPGMVGVWVKNEVYPDPTTRLTPKEFATYLSVARHDKNNNSSWRMGQTYFNTLRDLWPDIAEWYKGSPQDPFYNDARIPEFLNHFYNTFVVFE